jgi:hypothetical protein
LLVPSLWNSNPMRPSEEDHPLCYVCWYVGRAVCQPVHSVTCALEGCFAMNYNEQDALHNMNKRKGRRECETRRLVNASATWHYDARKCIVLLIPISKYPTHRTNVQGGDNGVSSNKSPTLAVSNSLKTGCPQCERLLISQHLRTSMAASETM